MTLYTTICGYLEPHVFSLHGNVVQVMNQDNVKFLKNKLKKACLPEIQVVYFDGKRTFTENELKSVAVTGECSDTNFVFKTMDELHSRYTFTRLIYVDPHPSHMHPLGSFVLHWAKHKGIATKPVPVIRQFGTNAVPIRFGKLFEKLSRTKPDVVVAFTNKAITPQVKKAQRAGVDVVFA